MLERIRNYFKHREEKILQEKISSSYDRLLISRLRKSDYPRAPEDIVDKLTRLTKRGAGELIPIRAAIELKIDERLQHALEAKNIEPLLKTPAGRIAMGSITVPTGTLGIVSDVDDDPELWSEGPCFIIVWDIKNPDSATGGNPYYYSYVPTVSYVKGSKYEELDFSLIEKTPEELGKDFSEFVKNEQAYRRRLPMTMQSGVWV